MRIFGSRDEAWLPPHEREGKLADMTRAGRYVGHSYSHSMCIVLDGTSNRLFHRTRALVFECLEAAAANTSDEPPMFLTEDSCIAHFV